MPTSTFSESRNMIRLHRKPLFTLVFAAVAAWSGCGVETTMPIAPGAAPSATSSTNTPDEVRSNIARAESDEKTGDASEKTVSAVPEAPAAEDSKPAHAVEPKALGGVAAAPAVTDGIKLTPAKWDEYLAYVKPKDGKKFTLVDAWATWCAPCKENFPHVVEMHEKYGPKGLQVISLSMDDLSDAKAVKEATDFLVSQKAVITNLIMNESQDVAFDKLEISAIPSVFIFDAQGKEVHRFTLEDPNDQFTYAQVEQAVEALLAGKPVPKFAKPAAK